MTLASLLFVLVVASAAGAGPPPFARGGFDHLSIPAGPLGAGLASRTLAPEGPVPRNPTTVPMWLDGFSVRGSDVWLEHGRNRSRRRLGDHGRAGDDRAAAADLRPRRLGHGLSRHGERAGGVLALHAGSVRVRDDPVPGRLPPRRLLAGVTTTEPEYHTLLGGLDDRARAALDGAGGKGPDVRRPRHEPPLGIGDGDWLSHQLSQAISSLHVDPRSLVVFLAYNIEVSYQGTPDSCFTTGCSLFAGAPRSRSSKT